MFKLIMFHLHQAYFGILVCVSWLLIGSMYLPFNIGKFLKLERQTKDTFQMKLKLKKLKIELNKMEKFPSNCRMTLLYSKNG